MIKLYEQGPETAINKPLRHLKRKIWLKVRAKELRYVHMDHPKHVPSMTFFLLNISEADPKKRTKNA